MTYQIISDSSCDLPEEVVKEKNIHVVPFYVSFNGTDYYREITEISIRDFYQKMVDQKGVYPKSSTPSTQDYFDAFEGCVKKDIPVICICITEKFSASFRVAASAREMILEQYPDAKITVINSQVDTVLQGLYTLEACRLRDGGASYEECIARLQDIRSSGRIFFTVGNLEYLEHGGRIGKLAGIAGKALGIKPVITLKEGEIFPSGLARTRKKSMLRVIDHLTRYIEESFRDSSEYEVCIGFGYSREEAAEFRELALEKLASFGITDIPLYQIGATIGVHTGPYPLGFGIIKKAAD
ncbi:MAG: DegV family protein [Muribaculaceae bacterium]|nr:DegV family protein [Roseburia sp.]MCM1432081.1 DegV family protein [Muribaculaceae bacterium]MCM1492119.1 DegV family protein [Muribaculaceae bacterium]